MKLIFRRSRHRALLLSTADLAGSCPGTYGDPAGIVVALIGGPYLFTKV